MQILVRLYMSWQEGASRKVEGSNPVVGKGYFYHEMFIKIYLMCDFDSLIQVGFL